MLTLTGTGSTGSLDGAHRDAREPRREAMMGGRGKVTGLSSGSVVGGWAGAGRGAIRSMDSAQWCPSGCARGTAPVLRHHTTDQ